MEHLPMPGREHFAQCIYPPCNGEVGWMGNVDKTNRIGCCKCGKEQSYLAAIYTATPEQVASYQREIVREPMVTKGVRMPKKCKSKKGKMSKRSY